MTQLTEEKMRQIVKEGASEAITDALDRLGIDSKGDFIGVQRDMAFLRWSRRTVYGIAAAIVVGAATRISWVIDAIAASKGGGNG